MSRSKKTSQHAAAVPPRDQAIAEPSPRLRWAILAGILILASTLRLVNLGQSPPGLNQDEAATAWNSWCLLKTGADQMGQRWPIFSSRCLGENRSPFTMYFMMPFLAMGGFTVPAMRMAMAVAGILSVILAYFVGRRMFGAWAGLAAAAMMAIEPWAVEQSRWAHDAALQPLVILATMAAMLWARLPLDDDRSARPRWAIALLAGATAGVSCYLYPSVRLFLPAFVTLAVAATWRAWWETLKTRRGAIAIAAFVLGVAATFGPLAYKHLTDEGMNKRGRTTLAWDAGDTFGEKLEKVADRYPGHYGLDFLFLRGDTYPPNHMQGVGQLNWYMLPLTLAGFVAMVKGLRKSMAARVLLVWLVVYPLGDMLSQHKLGDGMHALRSLPGLPALVLLAALGAAAGGRWLWRRKRPMFLPAAVATGLAVLACSGHFLTTFFGEYNKRPVVCRMFHTDVLEACDWLRPRLKDADAVFCTANRVNQPWLITLVGLQYDPWQWRDDPHVVATDEPGAWAGLKSTQTFPIDSEWDIHLRYGKVFFMMGRWWEGAYQELQQTHKGGQVIFVVRPDEGQMMFGNRRPAHEIIGPEGKPTLWIYEETL